MEEQVRADTCTIGLRPCRRFDVDLPASEVLPASFPRRDFSLVAKEQVVQPTGSPDGTKLADMKIAATGEIVDMRDHGQFTVYYNSEVTNLLGWSYPRSRNKHRIDRETSYTCALQIRAI